MSVLSLLNIGGQELLVILFIFSPLILAISALVQCATTQFANSNRKAIWILIILFAPLIGGLLWFVVGKDQATRQ